MKCSTHSMIFVVSCLLTQGCQHPPKLKTPLNVHATQINTLNQTIERAKSADQRQDYAQALHLYTSAIDQMTLEQRAIPRHTFIAQTTMPRLRLQAQITSGVLGLIQYQIEKREAKQFRYQNEAISNNVKWQIKYLIRANEVVSNFLQSYQLTRLLSPPKKQPHDVLRHEAQQLRDVAQIKTTLKQQYIVQNAPCLLFVWLCQMRPLLKKHAHQIPSLLIMEKDELGLFLKETDGHNWPPPMANNIVFTQLLGNQYYSSARQFALQQPNETTIDMLLSIIDRAPDDAKQEILNTSRRLMMHLLLQPPNVRHDALGQLYRTLAEKKGLAKQRMLVFQQLQNNTQRMKHEAKKTKAQVDIVTWAINIEQKPSLSNFIKTIKIENQTNQAARLLNAVIMLKDRKAASTLYLKHPNIIRFPTVVTAYARLQATSNQSVDTKSLKKLPAQHQQIVWAQLARIYLEQGNKKQANMYAQRLNGTLSLQSLHHLQNALFLVHYFGTKTKHQQQIDTLIKQTKRTNKQGERAILALLTHALKSKNEQLYQRIFLMIQERTKNNKIITLSLYKTLQPEMILYGKGKDFLALMKQVKGRTRNRLIASAIGQFIKHKKLRKKRYPTLLNPLLGQFNKGINDHRALDQIVLTCHPNHYDCWSKLEHAFGPKRLTSLPIIQAFLRQNHFKHALSLRSKIISVQRHDYHTALLMKWSENSKLQSIYPDFPATVLGWITKSKQVLDDNPHDAIWHAYIKTKQCHVLKTLPGQSHYISQLSYQAGFDTFPINCTLQGQHEFVLKSLLMHLKGDQLIDQLLPIASYLDASGLSQTPGMQKILRDFAQKLHPQKSTR